MQIQLWKQSTQYGDRRTTKKNLIMAVGTSITIR